MAADPIVYCLEQITDYTQFERLCSDLMAGIGYKGIEPIGGTGDRGRDAVIRKEDGDTRTVFAYSVRSDWDKKLRSDLARIQEEQHNPTQVVFVSTSRLSGSDRDEIIRWTKISYGWVLDIYDVERIRVLLNTELRHLVAQHPAIFTPPWFPRNGGLSVAESRDTLIIDHVSHDSALATWLSRCLSLRGFRVWCQGTAPLAGENINDSVVALIQSRAARYLPIVSRVSTSSDEIPNRSAVAGALNFELTIPCVSETLSDVQRARVAPRARPAHFNESWAVGLQEILNALAAAGISPSHDLNRGREIALADVIPEPVTVRRPEPVFANVFGVIVPDALLVFDILRVASPADVERWRSGWAYVQVSEHRVYSLTPPPKGHGWNETKSAGEFIWRSTSESEGKRVDYVMRELIKRSLDVAAAKAGLTWCRSRRVFYFPKPTKGEWNQAFTHVDGRATHVQMTGERQIGWGDRARKIRYQLGPRFRVLRDENDAWSVALRPYVRVTSLDGTPFEGKDIGRNRKQVTKGWWNREWLARMLGVMQALSSGADEIHVGDGEVEVTIQAKPVQWACPVAIDLEAMSRLSDIGEELAEISAYDDLDDDRSEVAAVEVSNE